MENISEASGSQREAAFETPASDSDSGDSLFLTQSVTRASRTVKRNRPSTTKACPFSQESEDEQERDGDPDTQHEVPSDSDSEPSYADLLHRWKSKVNTRGRIGRQPRPRKRVSPKSMVLPFLKTSGSGQLSGRRHKTVVNSEIGGFFKCILKLSKGHGERRRELSPSALQSDQDVSENEEDENVEENEEDEDIVKVSTDCFILGARNQQTWLPHLKWKTRQTPRKCTEKSNNGQEEQDKCCETRKVAEDLMEPQDDPDIHNESSSISIEESQSRKNGEKSRKSFGGRTPLHPHSSTSHLSSGKSPFVQSLFMEHLEEHRENQPKVLVACSQSQSLDRHQAPKIEKASENLMEPIDEIGTVAETQWPTSAYQDEDETQILEDSPTDRDGGEGSLCSENISFHGHQIQEEYIRKGIPHEPVENEDLGSGGFISSQDLFQEPNNQASPLKETSVENNKEVLDSRAVLHDDVDSVMKKRSSLNLADVEADSVTYSKSQRTQPTEIISPTVGDIWQERKEKGKKILDDGVEHMHPSMSSPIKDTLMVRQEEKTETPLFMYDGLKFLKRKKGKKTELPEISDKTAQIETDPGQNEGSVPYDNDMVKRKKRKKVKNEGLLEEPVDALPEISVPTDLGLTLQDCSVVCASLSGIKRKKKKKNNKNDGLLEESVDTVPEISVTADSSLSFQESSMASFGGSKPKKKRKKDKHGQPVPQEDQWIGVEEAIQIPSQGSDSLVSITVQLARTELSSPCHEVCQLDSSIQVNKDLVQPDGLQPRRKKKKKVKKRDSSPMMSDEMVSPQCSEESHPSPGTKTVKKKKQRFIDDVGEIATASKDLDLESLDKILEIPSGMEIQPVSNEDLKKDECLNPKKKKKRKRQEEVREMNVEVVASSVETTEQVEIPDAFQDSEQQAAEVVLIKLKKKKKKKKDTTETREEDEASQNAPVALGLGDMTTSNTPSSKSETGEIGEEEGLGGSEQVKKKKKKKKRKELDNDGSWSVSCDLACSHNAEQTTEVEEASSSGQKLGKGNPAQCLEIQSTNDTNEKTKCEGTKGGGSEYSQQMLQSEDKIQTKEKKKKKKKKKKRLVETDLEVYPGSPSDPSEAIIEEEKKKKKKKRKDTVDTGENESLGVLSSAHEPIDVLVTCHAKEDSIASSGGELLVNIKKKKKIRDSDNEPTIETEQHQKKRKRHHQ